MIYLTLIAGIVCGLVAGFQRGPVGGLLWGLGGAVAAALIYKALSSIDGGEK